MIAYFSIEIGVEPQMPTNAGGLGVLAADSIRSAAELKVPMVAVTLLHRRGYFRQTLSADEGRTVMLRAWRYDVAGSSGHSVPICFLDADLPQNAPWDRTLTDYLYGGDQHYRSSDVCGNRF